MATKAKPAFLFKGKETKGEEKAEKKMGKAAYAKGEKAEAKSTSKGFMPFKAGGKCKK
jgi:hypothetical protein